MRLDLNAEGLECQTQTPLAALCFADLRGFHDFAGKGFPVKVGPGRQVGVVVADRAIHLAHQLHSGDFFAAALQAHHHIGHFLAHRGGAGRLAMGAAEHGHFGKGVRHVAQLGDQPVQARQDDLGARALELQGVTGVVDVFAGTGKVHKLGTFFQLRAVLELGLDPVLHGFHVMVGDLFKILDGQGVGF